MQHEDIIEILNVMKQQENRFYRTSSDLYKEGPCTVISEDCRQLMVSWCIRIADHCHFDHETVAMAVNNLDRYAGVRPDILNDKREFQLAVMTCLYNSVKTHEPTAIGSRVMARLSKGLFSPKEFEEYEMEIMKRLKWRINTPTALSYVDLYLKLIPQMSEHQYKMIKKINQCQIDHTLKKSIYLGVTACELAFAVLCNSILIVNPSIRAVSYQCIKNAVNLNTTMFKYGSDLLNLVRNSKTLRSLSLITKEQSKKNSKSPIVELSPRTVTITR
eukprot:CAMPEP_0194146864 /NCGR_PEP_ID=MMETSP0152-20130528/22075_1 /TAXON_ID=1049557 /ORGANISM="Thalassiothrix antarctica, Strain L6-D1" /LENGTH=273 /DNA_ID=CAMNT_0038847503 /DNA_START=36 /DNA_END=857 /DNA_ORIENTATION=-